MKWFREQYDECGESSEEPFERTGPVVFHRQFIEFTASENSDNLVVDLQPSHGGTVGQVVMMRTQPCQLGVLAPIIGEFLDLIIDGFLQGRYLPNCKGEIPGLVGWRLGRLTNTGSVHNVAFRSAKRTQPVLCEKNATVLREKNLTSAPRKELNGRFAIRQVAGGLVQGAFSFADENDAFGGRNRPERLSPSAHGAFRPLD